MRKKRATGKFSFIDRSAFQKKTYTYTVKAVRSLSPYSNVEVLESVDYTGSYDEEGLTVPLGLEKPDLKAYPLEHKSALLRWNERYIYAVRAYTRSLGDRVYSGYGEAPAVMLRLSRPGYFETEEVSPTTVKLTWAIIREAHGYRIQRRPSGEKKWKTLAITKVNRGLYTDKTRKKNQKYDYRLCAYRKEKGKMKYSGGVSITYR